MMMSTNYIPLLLFIWELVYCQQYNVNMDRKWNGVGTVSLRPASNTSLCVAAESYKDTAYMKLVDCSFDESRNTRFDLGKLSYGSYEMRLTLAQEKVDPETGIFPINNKYGCLYAGYAEDSVVLSESCNPEDSWHDWRFHYASEHQIHWVHTETGKCVRAPTITNGAILRTGKCDRSDSNQIWKSQFEDQDSKWDASESVGQIQLKLAANESLCMTTQKRGRETSIIKLDSCSGIENLKSSAKDVFDLGKVAGDYLEIRTRQTAVSSNYWEYTCLYAPALKYAAINSIVYTKRCSSNDAYQRWKFLSVSATGLVQMYHKQNAKCIRATEDRKSVVTTECNKKDANQIWVIEHLR